MCGIFAVINDKNNDAAQTVLHGLRRLEYRGYDSWGIAVSNNKSITVDKHIGKISEAQINFPKTTIAIGHTRWATHGGITDNNAHPHYSTDKSFVLAQNGIVENYLELKKMLQAKGYEFKTETDTEIIVRLVEDHLKKTLNLFQALKEAFHELKGRNTVIVLTNNGQVIAARNGSPLVIGINENSDTVYFSSDTFSFAPLVKKIIVIDNGQLVTYTDSSIKVFDLSSGNPVDYKTEDITFTDTAVDKEGFPHFMIKEIYDNPMVINQVVKQEKQNYVVLANAIKKAHHVYTIGSGTAGNAASQMAYYLREYGNISATSIIGADAQEYFHLFTKDDLIIAPSQSGETADVIEVLEICQNKGMKIASYVNMPGSMMTRMSNFKFMADAGPEICVMSTKVFTSQVAWGYLVAKTVQDKFEEGVENLKELSRVIHSYLHNEDVHENLKHLAKTLSKSKDVFLLGKGQNFYIIKEGMVKIIEGSYKHAHAIPAGDLKHYAITLMEKGVPVLFALSHDKAQMDVRNAVNEVKARRATTIGIAPADIEGFDYHCLVPNTDETSAIMNILPLQLFSYYLAVEMGNNVDKPRNIAKSVTVK